MKKKFIILVVLLVAVVTTLGIFILYSLITNQNNILPIQTNLKCVTAGCSGQLCTEDTPGSSDIITTCEFRDEFICNKDCKARGNGCSFDTDFRDKCLSCISECKIQNNSDDSYQKCIEKCSKV